MDLLDILKGKFYTTHFGKYYHYLPAPVIPTNTPDVIYDLEAPFLFDYEYVDPTAWSYKQLIGNLVEKDGANCTIKTTDALNFKTGGYVITQDGKLYQVTSITRDEKTANKEAARLSIIPLNTEYVLRLQEIENPWELR